MPVAPTYPGVYIEEIPSGVHTITGVATSITAFIGYTARGLVNIPTEIFSYADYERAFGGLSIDSPVGYAVKDFFQNGGSDAWIIRVAKGAAKAAIAMKTPGGTKVLTVTASSEGIWGNQVRVDVDYDARYPDWEFNMTVTSYVEKDGQMVVDQTETWRNLSMVKTAPRYVETVINSASDLITVKREAVPTGSASSRSGTLALTDVNTLDDQHSRVAVVVDGKGPFEFDLFPAGGSIAGADLTATLANIAAKIAAELNARGVTVTGTSTGTDLTITSSSTSEAAEVRFVTPSVRSAVSILKLGTANGGTEVIPAANVRPAPTGLVSAPLSALPTLPTDGAVKIEFWKGAATALADSVNLSLWGTGSGTPVVAKPTTLDEVAQAFNRALAASTRPELKAATVSFKNKRFRLAANLPPGLDLDLYFKVSEVGTGTTASLLAMLAPDVTNFERYRLGVGPTALAQSDAVKGDDGTPPGTTELTGNASDKTGLYALESVDLFNILCLPDVTDASVLAEAVSYCERRRAFLLIDLPLDSSVASSALDASKVIGKARAWISTGDGSKLRSRNAATFFPRITEQDPLQDNVVRAFPNCGAMAGIFARTDADRGVWKAPAGTMCLVAGGAGVAAPLTDPENGVLNQLGLNCIRNFPVYGTVSWGARTMRGADQLADEYKYIPVRRLALFLEETLYRNTKWAVFEPNDEPLWAQLRLNIGAFMHTLFSQGAFRGSSPRDAYLVKCDKETTTPNDVDLGRVNILVGFAPLEPAEFVIIRIQQLAGQLQT